MGGGELGYDREIKSGKTFHHNIPVGASERETCVNNVQIDLDPLASQALQLLCA